MIDAPGDKHSSQRTPGIARPQGGEEGSQQRKQHAQENAEPCCSCEGLVAGQG